MTMLNALNALTRTYGYQMHDREIPQSRQAKHGFVPAEQYVREKPLTASLQLTSIQHCLDSPRWRRQHALDECMIALLTLNKNRPKPPLKQRQTMGAVA